MDCTGARGPIIEREEPWVSLGPLIQQAFWTEATPAHLMGCRDGAQKSMSKQVLAPATDRSDTAAFILPSKPAANPL
jgi:hypothetical protein